MHTGIFACVCAKGKVNARSQDQYTHHRETREKYGRASRWCHIAHPESNILIIRSTSGLMANSGIAINSSGLQWQLHQRRARGGPWGDYGVRCKYPVNLRPTSYTCPSHDWLKWKTGRVVGRVREAHVILPMPFLSSRWKRVYSRWIWFAETASSQREQGSGERMTVAVSEWETLSMQWGKGPGCAHIPSLRLAQ